MHLLPLLAASTIAMGDWIQVPGGTWSVDAHLASEAASKIHTYADDQASADGVMLQRWSSYTFQYQGRELSGHRVIYINAFCEPPSSYAKTQLVQVLDGGTCYFSAYYDPLKKTFFRMVFNGVA